jgi:hypothetical protein
MAFFKEYEIGFYRRLKRLRRVKGIERKLQTAIGDDLTLLGSNASHYTPVREMKVQAI